MALTYDMLTTSERKVVNAIVREMRYIVCFCRDKNYTMAHRCLGVRNGMKEALIIQNRKKFKPVELEGVIVWEFVKQRGLAVVCEYNKYHRRLIDGI